MFSLTPSTSRLLGKVFGKSEIETLATERVELHPATTTYNHPALSLPDEWDRVSQVYAGSDPRWEKANMDGGVRSHAATIGYRIREAVVGGQSVYSAGKYISFATARERAFLFGKPDRLHDVQLSSNWVSNKYFGHWLLDELPLDLLAEERGLTPLSLASRPWTHEQGYRVAGNLARNVSSLAVIRNLWIVDDRGNNDGRIARTQKLRKRFRRPGSNGPKQVYIDRGQTGTERFFANADEVTSDLESHGFKRVCPEQESVESLAQILSDAEVCVGVEGSHLAHAISLLPSGAKLVLLVPPQRFSSMMKVYADMAGIRTGYVIGDHADHPSGFGFTMPLDRIKKVIDMVSASNAAM